ncbi:Myomegalin [Trichoplax sp. H2]|nr:Myomegalin [Trichoplax sp. H2]|eukprot:RDD43490.1 Myomegalin [Trichoplax sp. H2]
MESSKYLDDSTEFDASQNFARKYPIAASYNSNIENNESVLNDSVTGGLITKLPYFVKEHTHKFSQMERENFNLKQRLYKAEQLNLLKIKSVDDSTGTAELIEMNTTLVAEIENLQLELREREALLLQASTTVDSLTNHNEQQIAALKAQYASETAALQRCFDAKTSEMKQTYNDQNRKLKQELQMCTDSYAINLGELKSTQAECEQLQDRIQKMTDNKQKEIDVVKSNIMGHVHEKESIIQELRATIEEKEQFIAQIKDNCEKETKRLKDSMNNLIREAQIKENALQDKQIQLNKQAEEIKELSDRLNSMKLQHQQDHDQLINEISEKTDNSEKLKLVLNKTIQDKDNEIEDLKEQLRSTNEAYDNNLINVLCKIEAYGKSDQELQKLFRNQESKMKILNSLESAEKTIEKVYLDRVEKKSVEVNVLKEKIESLSEAMARTKEISRHTQARNVKSQSTFNAALRDKDTTIANLKANLHEQQLTNARLSESIKNKVNEIEHLTGSQKRVEQQLLDIMQQNEQQIKDLKEQTNKTNENSQRKYNQLEDHYKVLCETSQHQLTNNEKRIQSLSRSLRDKDQLLQACKCYDNALKILNYCFAIIDATFRNLSEDSMDKEKVSNDKPSITEQLQKKLRDTEMFYQNELGRKDSTIEAKDSEILQLKTSASEKNRLISQLKASINCLKEEQKRLEIVKEDNGKIISQLENTVASQGKVHNEAADLASKAALEKDAVIQRLTRDLANCDNAMKIFYEEFGEAVEEGANYDLLKQLRNRLVEKDQLVEEILTDQTKSSVLHEMAIQRMIQTLQEKDMLLKESAEEIKKLQEEKNHAMQRLNTELNSKSMDLKSLGSMPKASGKDNEFMLTRLRMIISEKDRTIEQLVESGLEKDRLFKKLQNVRGTNPMKDSEMKVLQQRMVQLETIAKNKDDALQKFEVDKTEKEVALAEANVNVKTFRRELESRITALTQANLTIDHLKKQQEAYNLKIEDLAKSDARLREEILELQQQNMDIKSTLDSRVKSMESLNESVHAKDALIEELRFQLTRKLQNEHEKSDVLQGIIKDLENLVKEKEAVIAQFCSSPSKKISVSSQTFTNSPEDCIDHADPISTDNHLQFLVNCQLNSLRTLREILTQPRYAKSSQLGKSSPESFEKGSSITNNTPLQVENEISAMFVNMQKLEALLNNLPSNYAKISESESGSNHDILIFLKNEIANLNSKLLESEKININLKLQLNQAKIFNEDMSTVHEQLNKSKALCNTLQHQLEVAEMKAINEESTFALHSRDFLAAKQQLIESDKIIESLREENETILEGSRTSQLSDDNEKKQLSDMNKRITIYKKLLEEKVREIEHLRKLQGTERKDVGNHSPSQSDQIQTDTQVTNATREEKEVEYLRSELRKFSIRHQQTIQELGRIREENSDKNSQICSLEAKLHVLKVVNKAEFDQSFPNNTSNDNSKLFQGWLNELEEFSITLKREIDACLQLEVDPLSTTEVNSDSLPGRNIKTATSIVEHEQRKYTKQTVSINFSFLVGIRQLKARLEEWLLLKESLQTKFEASRTTDTGIIPSEDSKVSLDLMQLKESYSELLHLLDMEKEQCNSLQALLSDKDAIIQEKSNENDELSKRLNMCEESLLSRENELHSAKGQLEETKYLLMTLKSELAIYDKIATIREHDSGIKILQDEISQKNQAVNISSILDEIRCLSEQLQQGLDASNILREKLSQKLTESDVSAQWKNYDSKIGKNTYLPETSKYTWQSSEENKVANDHDLSNKSIRFVIKTEHLETLKVTVAECRKSLENVLARWDVQKKDTNKENDRLTLLTSLNSKLRTISHTLDSFRMSVIAAPDSSNSELSETINKLYSRNNSLRLEVTTLKRKIRSQEQLIDSAARRVKTLNEFRENFSSAFLNKINRTQHLIKETNRMLKDKADTKS